MTAVPLIFDLAEVRLSDLPLVGGKNASLGELTALLGDSDLSVSPGFVVTAEAYRQFVDGAGIGGSLLACVAGLDPADINALAKAGTEARHLILSAPPYAQLDAAIRNAYADLGVDRGDGADVAARSSATAEDLPDASFAGQHDTFLHIVDADSLVEAVRRCFASLYTDRAIAYRIANGFDHAKVFMSVGIQRMVDAARGASGVMFTVDPETAWPDEIQISSVWGLGEGIVSGQVDPDEARVFKPLLADATLAPVIERRLGAKEMAMRRLPEGGTRLVPTEAADRQRFVLDEAEILTLARGGALIEAHYGKPMDIEWARGSSGTLFILQARPETGHGKRMAAGLKNWSVKRSGPILLHGTAVGEGAVSAPVIRLTSPQDSAQFAEGAILVAPNTDPDWAPLMQRAAAIVTDHGGRTSHAAIVAREFGIPGVVGTGDATSTLSTGQVVTASALDGTVSDGAADIDVQPVDLTSIPETRTRIMLNLADPAAAARWWRLPADGVGLARMEFIISNGIGAHPMAFARPEALSDADRNMIAHRTAAWADPVTAFTEQLACGIARIAATAWPDPAIVRLSDFKSNEYAALPGGRAFEPDEENPMIGWRGASRYTSADYAEGFALECRAIRRAREHVGLTNIVVMVPFCRTLGEAERTLAALAKAGLQRGTAGLQIYMMAEIPANALLAEEFAAQFDGFSIGSNDLTQLTLGVDRDSERLAHLFDETDKAVIRSIEMIVDGAKGPAIPVGLCGQRPSDDPDFAAFLVRTGLTSISVTPDSFARVKAAVAKAES